MHKSLYFISIIVLVLYGLYKIFSIVLLYNFSSLAKDYHYVAHNEIISANSIFEDFKLHLSTSTIIMYSEDYYGGFPLDGTTYRVIKVSSTPDFFLNLSASGWIPGEEDENTHKLISEVNSLVSEDTYRIPDFTKDFLVYNVRKGNNTYFSVYSESNSMLYLFADKI